MTMTTPAAATMPIPQLMRARRLVPPAERRAIRDRAKLSRDDIVKALRAKGITVSASAVAFWEMDKADGGFDPRPRTAIVYRRLLDQIQAELEAQELSAAEPRK